MKFVSSQEHKVHVSRWKDYFRFFSVFSLSDFVIFFHEENKIVNFLRQGLIFNCFDLSAT